MKKLALILAAAAVLAIYIALYCAGFALYK